MKRKLWRPRAHLALILTIALMPTSLSADYQIFHQNGKAGVKDDAGNIVIAPNYDYLYPLSNSTNARFGGGGTFGMLDMRDGTVLLPVKYKLIGDYYNGLAVVSINNKRGYVDLNGNFVFEPQFDDAASFYNGTAEVSRGGRRFYIGVDGKEYDTRPTSDQLSVTDYVARPRATESDGTATPSVNSNDPTADKQHPSARPEQEKASRATPRAKASGSQKPGSSPSQTSNGGTPTTDSNRQTTNDRDWHKITPTPYLSSTTRFFNKNVNFDNLPQVSEGIFYIQEYNRSIGYASYYGFWTVDGRRLFPAQYEGFTTEQPRFDSGACIVKATGTKRPTPIILYADGTSKALSHEWDAMTQFYDGVAMVREILGMKSTNLFYINTKGEKIWPHLAENGTKGSISVHMRPLREGRRAFYSNADRAWGFLDKDGKVVIKPTFMEVRDFNGGYALVIVPENSYSGKAVFIDPSGRSVVTVPADVPSLMYSANVTDITDGYFAVSDPSGAPTKYYDIKGNEVKEYAGGATQFADGTAFMRLEKYGEEEAVKVINTNFDVVGQWPFLTSEFINNKPTFSQSPYYTFNQRTVINHLGEPVLWVNGSIMSEDRLGQFSPDGYAAAHSVFCDPVDPSQKISYTGYVEPDGHYSVVFSSTPGAGGPFENIPGPIPPIYGPVKDIIPDQTPGLTPGDTTCIGPVGDVSTVLYNVRATAYPAKGGTVYGTGKYAYGDTIRVTGTPAEGYKLSGIECSRNSARTDVFNKFAVQGDMEITCYFVKEDDVTDVTPGCFAGTLPQMALPVYVQLGDPTGNRFGAGSRGFLAVTLDSSHNYGNEPDDGPASLSVNMFFVPMNILGETEEEGHRYLVLDGGIIKYSNLSITDNTAVGALNNPLLQMMLMFDGADSGELRPGRYRVEIREGSANDGAFTLGMMQRLSPRYGWISADDPSFHKPLGGFFIKRIDKGLDASFFNDVKLKKCRRKEVEWYPAESFNNDNISILGEFGKRLGELYNGAVSGRPELSDYDFKQFSTDLDNNLFKAH